MKPTALFRAYTALSMLAQPLAARIRMKKLAQAGVSPTRRREISGHASQPRPQGRLIWVHAASVGESLSVLALIETMGGLLPGAHFLITSGTATSAELIQARMPPRSLHQFAPIDAPAPLRRFLGRWKPDAAILVESELWPNTLIACRKARVPLALVNARLSLKSLKGWRKRPDTARFLFHDFALVLAQSKTMAQSLVQIGTPAHRTRKSIDLKSLSPPLPVNSRVLEEMRATFGTRPLWVACSTHDREEEIVLEAHLALLEQHPDLCLILVPRHPERGDEIESMLKGRALKYTRRSAGDKPAGQVYLADTLGEVGLWYTLAPFAFIGGSLFPVGGHNPFEAAQTGTAILSGPHVTNFASAYASLAQNRAARIVNSAPDITELVDHWLRNPQELQRAQKATTVVLQDQSDQLNAIAQQLMTALKLS